MDLLEYLCVFDKEQNRLGNTWLPKRVALRAFLIASLVPIVVFWFVLYPAHEFPVYFTNWGLLMTIASLLLSSILPYDLHYRQKPNKMALHHLMICASFTA